ncbi:MAG: tetratricopeptide repeat protein [Cyanobacteria bacterium]|nr:tetratricopeptide repeat protein [Cyanobacteriota bacterium]MDA1020129.1 tetratricopeptide repeat protein [Cyanobacteriota bacterium]
MSSAQHELLQQACSLLSQNKLLEAVTSLEQIVAEEPSNQQALYLLGQTLAKLKQWQKAIPVLQKVVACDSANAHACYCLAYCFESIKSYAEAMTLYKQVIHLDIDYWKAYTRIANILLSDTQESLAIKYLVEAEKINGPDLDTYKAFSQAYQRLGVYDMAYQYCEHAYDMTPHKDLLAVLIFLSHYNPNKGLVDFRELAEEYNAKFLSGKNSSYEHSQRKIKPKIRLGFVSADFRNHPVSSYLISVFKSINKEDFEIYLYYNGEKVQEQTELLKELADSFSFVKELGDEQLADQIFAEEIDILFDMSGHTSGERLGVFKLKPAPIQITHHGYFGTLAIPEIEHIIADDYLIPKEEEKYFSENIIRLKSFTHADLYAVSDDQSQAPCLSNGYISFAGMNSVRKISKEVIETWAEVMKAVPNSKIQLDSRTLTLDANKEYFYKVFEEAGIKRSRVIIESSLERADYLSNFHKVDCMLDTFPFGGGTSALEALMSGVPVLTIEGDRWVARMGASILKNIGHEELIAENREQFIQKAVELAENTERIAAYRTSLPAALKKSPLNIESFVRDFEFNLKEVYSKLNL